MGAFYHLAKITVKSFGRNPDIEAERKKTIDSLASKFNASKQEQVRGYLEGMVDRFDQKFHSASVMPMDSYLRSFLDDIIVDNCPVQGPEPIVIVSNHRSMLDFLIKGVSLSHHGINPPKYTAGQNLLSSVFDNVLRKWGAVGIDRSRGGLYLKTQCALFTQLLLEGNNLIIYPEAGRSYSGLIKPLKKAMLQSVIDAHGQNKGLPHKIVVSAVSYDRVAEDYLLVRSPERGKKKSAGELLYGQLGTAYVFFLRPPNCGNAYLTFGNAFSLCNLDQNNLREGLIDRVNKEFRSLYRVTRAEVCAYSAIGRPTHDLYRENFKNAVTELKSKGANVYGGLYSVEPIELLEDPLMRRLIRKESNLIAPVNNNLVDYYANTVRSILNES